MQYLNYEFFEKFKDLDNLCKDIYGKTDDNRLGVTLYIEEMDNKFSLGEFRVVGWKQNYKKLKHVRHIRNELAHSRNTFSTDICTREDIEFLVSFRSEILNGTDPLARIKKNEDMYSRPRQSYGYTYTKPYTPPSNSGRGYRANPPAKVGRGYRFGCLSLFLIFIITFIFTAIMIQLGIR